MKGHLRHNATASVQRASRKEKKKATSLGLMTANVTSKGSLLHQRLPLETEGLGFVFLQEHKSLAGELSNWEHEMKKDGWCCFLDEALKTPKQGRAGGTGFLWRHHLQLRQPPCSVESSRAAIGKEL